MKPSENSTRPAAEGYHVSQPTISRAITTIINALAATLEPLPAVKDLDPDGHYLLDGTLLPCYGHEPSTVPEGKPSYYTNLYSSKHHTTGHNLQVLTDQNGHIVYFSPVPPGCTHDATAIQATGVLEHLNSEHVIADLGYQGLDVIHPFRRQAGQKNYPTCTKSSTKHCPRYAVPLNELSSC